METKRLISPQRIRQVAAAAEVDAGTVRRYFNGLPTRQTPRERVERALRTLGLEALCAPPSGDGDEGQRR